MDNRDVDSMLSRNEIPIVDIAHMGPVTTPIRPWLQKAADQLNKSLSNKGLVFIVNHGITEEKLQAVYSTMDKFCSLPDEHKSLYSLNPPDDNQGYIPPNCRLNIETKQKEARHSYSIQNFARKIPEQELPGFQEIVSTLAYEFCRLARLILQIVAVGLDLNPNIFLNAHLKMLKEDNSTTFRMIYYPPLGQNIEPGVTRCREQTDYGTFTLFAQDSEGGLEVQRSGGMWCKVGHLPGAILVNTGDLLEQWTSGKYLALKHRVTVPEHYKTRTRARHSIAFFVHPDDSTVIDPLTFIKSKPVLEMELPKHHLALVTTYHHWQRRLKKSYA
uniref:Fe2OG dioxygenase domain-containing protein n=1 Tax=Clastoptera arizonana TaxID=38151 RepID=A0A1B6EE80_9HEMI